MSGLGVGSVPGGGVGEVLGGGVGEVLGEVLGGRWHPCMLTLVVPVMAAMIAPSTVIQRQSVCRQFAGNSSTNCGSFDIRTPLRENGNAGCTPALEFYPFMCDSLNGVGFSTIVDSPQNRKRISESIGSSVGMICIQSVKPEKLFVDLFRQANSVGFHA